MGEPLIKTCPLSALKTSVMILIVVVFPAPFLPKNPKARPLSTLNEISVKTLLSPKDLFTCFNSRFILFTNYFDVKSIWILHEIKCCNTFKST